MTKSRIITGIGILVLAVGIFFFWLSRRVSLSPSESYPSQVQTSSLSPITSITNNPITTNLVDARSVPEGTDPDYLAAARSVIEKCGKAVQLVEVKATALPAVLTYYYFRADCGLGIEQIYVSPGYGPATSRVEPDNRQPISLSKWRISATRAIQIAGFAIIQNEANLDLLQKDDALVWDITQGGSHHLSETKVDATTGQIISSKTTFVPGIQ